MKYDENPNSQININLKSQNEFINIAQLYINNYGPVEPNCRLLIDKTTGLECDETNPNCYRFGHIFNEMKNGRKHQNEKETIIEMFKGNLIKNDRNEIYNEKANECAKVYKYLINDLKDTWNGNKFDENLLENIKDLLNLKYTIKQLNEFITHIREDKDKIDKFEKITNIKLKIVKSDIENFRNDIERLQKYYNINHRLPALNISKNCVDKDDRYAFRRITQRKNINKELIKNDIINLNIDEIVRKMQNDEYFN